MRQVRSHQPKPGENTDKPLCMLLWDKNFSGHVCCVCDKITTNKIMLILYVDFCVKKINNQGEEA